MTEQTNNDNSNEPSLITNELPLNDELPLTNEEALLINDEQTNNDNDEQNNENTALTNEDTPLINEEAPLMNNEPALNLLPFVNQLEQIPTEVLDEIILIAILSGQSDHELEELMEHYRIKLYEKLLSMDYNEINEQINKSCPICNEELNVPYVKLYCDCEYHLHCFKALKADINECIYCHDKIFKNNDDEYKTCSICLEPLKDEIQKLFCDHFFHWQCIRKWYSSLQQNNHKCPICRCTIVFM